jgi:hypothetical protein
MAPNDQTPYADKLRDPRWQRKRLEILRRDDDHPGAIGHGPGLASSGTPGD